MDPYIDNSIALKFSETCQKVIVEDLLSFISRLLRLIVRVTIYDTGTHEYKRLSHSVLSRLFECYDFLHKSLNLISVSRQRFSY